MESRSVEELQQIAVDVACFLHQQRAERIRILRVREMLQISSFFILASGRSGRQVRNFGDAVERHLKPLHLPRLGIHGRDDARWFCIDHGEIVLHLFDEESREMYDLDQLWAHAPLVEVDFKALATAAGEQSSTALDSVD
ncbi:MAG: ribosome silencing factor [Planctomycetes bacterium]|nr:ribosome silencing factor [Planctomycetota bacterium]